MGDRLPRKLAAILYADVAGYSRLTGEDEDATHRQLSDYLDLISATVEDHRGRVVHYAGDAVLARFDAVIDAVSSSVAIQEQLGTLNRGLPVERRLEFRVGVNLGDVIDDRDDIYGDGVNVAARLEALAEPGGICISESVRSAVGKNLDVDYEDLGEQTVKNIERPVRAYRVMAGNATTRITASRATGATGRPSIAVLPFVNATGDPGNDYFSDGLAMGVVTELARSRSLSVKSAIWRKDRADDHATVAGKLGVRYLLEGSIQKSGERVRISVDLVDAGSGETVWAERFDRTGEDVLTIQDDITGKISTTLYGYRGRIQDLDFERTVRKPTSSFTAYDLVLLGSHHKRRYTQEDNAKAKQYLEEAIELDPGYADAYTWLSWVYALEVDYSSTEVPESIGRRAIELARKAIELDKRSDYAHSALGLAYVKSGQYERAVEAYDRALSLNPNNADIMALKSAALALGGRADEGCICMDAAMQLNPDYPEYYDWILGIACFALERYEDAVNALVRMSEPNVNSLLWLAASYAQLGLRSKSAAAARRVLEIQPDFRLSKNPSITKLGWSNFSSALRKAGLPE